MSRSDFLTYSTYAALDVAIVNNNRACGIDNHECRMPEVEFRERFQPENNWAGAKHKPLKCLLSIGWHREESSSLCVCALDRDWLKFWYIVARMLQAS